MAIADMVLKAKVNLALVRDPRVGSLDIAVAAKGGIVTLTGDVDSQAECMATESVARTVDGVQSVNNELTCGVGRAADTAEHVGQRLLDKLDSVWKGLPDQTALTQADYLRWALWLVYKFRLPEEVAGTDQARLESEATEQALAQISGYVGVPKAMLALELLRQAEFVGESSRTDAPQTDSPGLVTTPVVPE